MSKPQPPTDSSTWTNRSQPDQAPENLSYPKRIHRYRILNVLGSGGMGDVFLAQQDEPLQRQVALKVIRFGRKTRDIVGRFETERRALALMNHPFIAQVYDAGSTEDGRPYFVMEYVEGETITEYCDQHNMSLEDRLWLFRRVCEAVHHAHQRGIIHRDLKPSNILVLPGKDGFAIPKVIDFGVAKAMGHVSNEIDVQTLPERIVGTLYYMSPEQMEGSDDVDIRTDVYALGVLLYELLVGRLPFEAPQVGGLLAAHKILDTVPERPSVRIGSLDTECAELKRRQTDHRTLVRLLQGDLDWITMKALDRERERRYGSVLELESDIRNYMNSRPVLARPPKTAYRLKKWILRHRVVSVAVFTAIVSLIAGTITASVGYTRAERERQRAIASEASAVAALTRAEQLEQRANTVNAFLIDMIGASDPKKEGRDVRVLEVLNHAEKSLESDHSWSPVERAALHEAMGRTFIGLGELERAATHLEAALTQLENNESEVGQRFGVKIVLSRALFELGRFAEGERHLNDVVNATGDFSDRDDVLSQAHNNLSFLYMNQGHFDRAEHHLLESKRYSLRTYPADDPHVVSTDANLAVVLIQKREYEAAEPVLRKVLEHYLARLGPKHPDTLTQMNNLGSVLGNLGKLDEAVTLVEQAYKVQLETLGPNHPNTLGTINNYVSQLTSLKRYEEALPLQTDLAQAAEKFFGLAHPNTLTVYFNLAQLQLASHQLDAAFQSLETLEQQLGSVFPEDHYRHLDLLQIRAKALEARGDMGSALAQYAELVSRMDESNATSDMMRLYVSEYVELLRDNGRAEEADNLEQEHLNQGS